ncbi:MAG: hypothetical protein GY861_21745 [bacterium]|nr:hypothetical protein [bacterium]
MDAEEWYRKRVKEGENDFVELLRENVEQDCIEFVLSFVDDLLTLFENFHSTVGENTQCIKLIDCLCPFCCHTAEFCSC